ncbi:3-methyladenine DNA glycosylase/8-oxoguanine DNA glycosylase-like protein [Xylanimonas cellulosilytica DSM 15894]|uniref:3-methyladenine DNA glycosylase/8-oxoguanine DNA glycosylase-like protein n=1 Tax=Xylanimonas cellulosilytica (strain DSM 15894 / JCM 12276 / CECT 5975 / KCTC 9989 / LMG 20990 / NBRC 107835 / XIL07) TaxID=446471 RepID=D1BU34_XYLCX|nr:DNA-3-methyladenine glycosylase [Xylanimonas cellulosilytica]ACZ29198.1 3-methyladenine DNA glycosylase/8-oxoguanine DNA glycosylase-like protein [Xylanimonas cellulosilytica DSM 15894]
MRVRHESSRPLDVALTLAQLGHGRYDPAVHRTPDGALWRTSLLPTGPVTARIVQDGPRSAVVDLWGDGAREAADGVPSLLGEDDDDAGFTPPPQLRDASRRAGGMRMPRTGRVLESLVPAILEQRVQTVTAHRAWRWLLTRYGSPAPGPAPSGMRVVPAPRQWAAIPSWDWHRAGVDPGRARIVTTCARLAARLEEAAHLEVPAARARLEAVRGVGVWTSAEVAQRAFGDADAVSLGDFNLPGAVGWALTGERTDDAGMLALLAPYAPHRHRVVRLISVSGRARAPRRGPQTAIVDHRRH